MVVTGISRQWSPIIDKNSSMLITCIGRSHMMGSSKSTVIISCINVPILFSRHNTLILKGHKKRWTFYFYFIYLLKHVLIICHLYSLTLLGVTFRYYKIYWPTFERGIILTATRIPSFTGRRQFTPVTIRPNSHIYPTTIRPRSCTNSPH